MSTYVEYRLGDKLIVSMVDAVEDIVHFGLTTEESFCGASNFSPNSGVEDSNPHEICEDCLPDVFFHLGISGEDFVTKINSLS